MKKLCSLLCVGAVFVMMIGCGLTDPVTTPTITIDNIGTIDGGTYKNVTGKIEAGQAITSVSYAIVDASDKTASGITVDGPSSSSEKKMEFTASSPIKITVSNTAAAGNYKLKISVSAGASATGSFDFTVNAAVQLLDVKATGCKIANVQGKEIGAYNLVSSERVAASSSEDNKDLKDLSVAGEGYGNKIGSGNQSKFASATEADYTGATAASVKEKANAATADNITIAVGTVFVVKLGNSRGFAIVKITAVDPNFGESTTNKGEATFEYKFTAN